MTNIKKEKMGVWNVYHLNSRPAAKIALFSLSGFGVLFTSFF